MKTQKHFVFIVPVLIVCVSFVSCQLKERTDVNVAKVQTAASVKDTAIQVDDTDKACSDTTWNEIEDGGGEHLQEIINSIVKGNKKKLASLCLYPIRRSYPLHDIKNAKEMERYFHTIFDKHFRKWLKDRGIEGWGYNGRQRPGFTCHGEMWVYGLIYDVRYSSAKEQKNRQKLMKQELNSLHKSLRGEGWYPYFCYKDINDGSVMRIDRNDYYGLRFAKYKKGRKSSDLPDKIMYGTEYVGTAGPRDFEFDNAQGDSIFIHDEVNFGEPFLTTNELTIESYGRDKYEHEIRKFYWLDEMRK